MANAFMDALENEDNRSARTQNGAVTLKSTKSSLLDFFSRSAAMRDRDEKDIVQLFSKALSEDPLNAMKALFYVRDCRGGQGERRAFRAIWKWLVKNYPDFAKANLANVPFYGRWDDLFFDIDTLQFAAEYVKENLSIANPEYSVLNLYKWMPSINTSSKETRSLAWKFVDLLHTTPRSYRKMLSEKRAQLDIVERKMSAGLWGSIKFEAIPSKASLLYRKAFKRRDGDRYSEYLTKVEKGEAKINASVTFPYEIVREYLNRHSDNDRTLNAAWNALPDYIPEGESGLVVADVSGSMSSNENLPLAVSISLAMYMAERNKDPNFKDRFITFSAHPELVKVQGRDLYQKIQNLNRAQWDMNTNLQAVFDLILDTAVRAKVPQKDMPSRLFIVSDMEFDSACRYKTNFEVIKAKYASAGYGMPTLVFWNVDAKSDQSPVRFDEKGVMLVSGCSPTIFKNVMLSKVTTPYEMMLEVLNQDRYARVTI